MVFIVHLKSTAHTSCVRICEYVSLVWPHNNPVKEERWCHHEEEE